MSDSDELTPFANANAQRAEVESHIPHRDPFLFVDRIVETGMDQLVVRWTVREDSDFFRGHYPGQPVTPGVILSEHAFQAGAILVSLALGGFKQGDGVPVLTRVRDARFKKLVPPGATVETTVKVEDQLGPVWNMQATVRLDGAVCVKLRYALSATEAMTRISNRVAGGETSS